jgi:LacI family transcriptional regulator
MADAVTQRKSKRVTLADVAKAAGVSVATASVAITGRPSGNCRVSPGVAEKIRAIAQQLNYRPNLQARNLSTRRTHTVALLIKRATWHNAMFYVSSAQQVLRRRGYIETFMLLPENTVESEREALELCVERGVEGIIALPLIDLQGRANVETFNRLHRDDDIPVVQLGTELPGCVAPSVTADIPGGIAKTVTLLHAMGHRRIAMATMQGYDSPEVLNPFRFANLVATGYQRGMKELKLEPQIFVAPPGRTEASEHYDNAVALAPQIAAATPRPTAVIAFSEYSAAGLMAGLPEQGLRVPDDISIVSGGEQPFTRMIRPALTAVAQPFEQMGETATEMLLRMIEGGDAESVSLMPSLILRGSTRELR